ncbi:Sodium/hydrogen exchanger [Phytophthora nicotianae]|uniref:Sodium/hydrogen exchanger n=1 Tax=Phytophthora nicotianae TaxID=4792 RepID=A0A0W8D8B2_PHYNI|nr:Sodium/hydrogen exchanger [Phytophthora nicotianae]
MDCLKKLPDRLPEYRRVLDVIIAVIESGLYLKNPADSALSALDPAQDEYELPHERRLLYFEAFRALQTMANSEQTRQQPSTGRISLNYRQDKHNDIPLRQRIAALFNQLENDEDKKELFGVLLRANLMMLARLACEEVLKHYLGTEKSENVSEFISLLMQKISPADTIRLLIEISLSRSAELQKFAHDNIDSLLDGAPAAAENKNPALFQRLVDRHPQEFAAILWQSPYLTAHIFQMVLEDFLVNHPRGLADLLMNRSSAIAAVVKAKPYILSVLAASPEIVSSVIKSNPQALPQVVREDSNTLAAVFATVPQCLGDTLEKHPEFFVDLAHRKPALVSRLFAEHPDLLLVRYLLDQIKNTSLTVLIPLVQEPLETNPALFTTFLVYHRSVLPDFNDPDFDPTVFKLKTIKKVDACVQTSKTLNQGRRKLRSREKLRRDCEELLESLKAATAVTITATCTQITEAKSEEELLNEESSSTVEILNEIARLYVAKIAADEHDDAIKRKRQSLADFVMELYTLELGFKPLAKKKLLNLLVTAKQIGNVPEAMRIKWFRRFLNAIPGDRPLPQTALDFFLLVLQHLIPGGHLSLHLEAASFNSCIVSQSTLKTLVDDPLVSRLFDNKEQCDRMLAFQTILIPSRQNIMGSVTRSSVTMLSMLPLDDVLDSIMKVWMQYQLRCVLTILSLSFLSNLMMLKSTRRVGGAFQRDRPSRWNCAF